MVMNYGNLKQVTLGEAGTVLVAEGAGVATGFIGGAFVGRQVQNLVKKDEEIVDMTDKLLAWGANNVPKLAIWWMARDLGKEEGLLGTAIDDGRKAFAGSAVFDTLMRLTNGGKNPATASLFGYQILGKEAGGARGSDVQRVLQENSALRTELNKALQRLATQPAPRAVPQAAPQATPQAAPGAATPVIDVYPKVSNTAHLTAPEVAERQRRFGAMQQVPPRVQEREKKFGFMQTPPAVAERERKYGFAGTDESMSSAAGFKNGENEGSMAKMSGFL